jgi:hypothetical protein
MDPHLYNKDVGRLFFERRENLVTLGRFELPTCGLGNRRSIHLSYRAILKILRDGFRKPPGVIRLAVPARSHLSYRLLE